MRLVLGLSEGVHCVVWKDERGEWLLQLVYSLLPPLLYMTFSEHVPFILPSSVHCCVRVFFGSLAVYVHMLGCHPVQPQVECDLTVAYFP